MRIFIILLIIFLNISCNRHLKYQADWVIIKTKYKGNNILNAISVRKLKINFGEGGIVPPLFHDELGDSGINYPVDFSYYNKKGKNYIKIKGSKFFTDTFEVKCKGEPCCEIILENEKKYIELIYNGELSSYTKRRNCPNARDILYNLNDREI